MFGSRRTQNKERNGRTVRRFGKMTNAFLFIGIIIQVLAVLALAWGIWNEDKLVRFERRLIRVIRAKRRAKKAAKKSAAPEKLSPDVYYTPVKPRGRHTVTSFDAA